MKIRTDFVTNSSSSCFVVMYEIKDGPELRAYLKEEYGNNALKLANALFMKGKDSFDAHWIHLPQSFDPEKTYLQAVFGDDTDEYEEDNAAILAKCIPEGYKTQISKERDLR